MGMSEDYKCEECGETFDSERGLHIHIGRAHPDKKEALLAEGEQETKETEGRSEEPKRSESFFSSKKNLIASVGVAVVLVVVAMLLLNVSGDFPDLQVSNASSSQTEATAGEVAATVNGEPIMSSRVEQIMQQASMTGQNVSRRQIVDQLINQEILRQQAEKEGYSVSREEVEQLLSAQMARRNMSLDDLKQRVEQQGGSWEEQIESYQEQLAVRNYIDDAIAGQVAPVTEEEIQQRYEIYKQQTEQEVPPLEQVKQQINATLQQQKAQQAQSALIQQLKSGYNIEYK